MLKISVAVICYIAAFIVFVYMRKAVKNKTELGTAMARILGMALAVMLSFTISLLSNQYFIISIGNSLQFIAIDWLLFFLVEYIYKFTDSKLKFKPGKKILFTALIVDNVLLILNPFFEFVLTYKELTADRSTYLIFQPKLWFHIHLNLCYLMVLLIFYIIIKKCMKVPRVYRGKYSMIFLSLLLIVVFNAYFLFTDAYIDLSIISYGLATCLTYYFTFEYRTSSIIKKTRVLIIENMINPIILFNFEGRFSSDNKRAEEIFSLHGTKKEITLDDFIKEQHLEKHIHPGEDCEFEKKIRFRKEVRWYHVEYTCIWDDKKQYLGSFFVYNDITEQKRMLDELIFSANHDLLTGIYNRNYLLKNWVGKEEKFPYAIALWNVNGLRLINKFYGNETGDNVLCQIVQEIEKHIRKEDILIRLDGDDILVIMPELSEKEAVAVMNRIHGRILANKESQIDISAEFGVAVRDKEEIGFQECLAQATNTMHQKKMQNQDSVRSSILESLKKSLSQSDYETEEHAERTRETALKLGEKLGLSDRKQGELGLLSILHDIGKVSIPDSILLKPAKLTEEEWVIMKSHAVKGYEIARITTELETIAEYILHHHEKWDGTGYPDSLKGDEIPLLSRIITVVDSYDVMTHNRPYHKAMPKEKAVEELLRCSGTQFDPFIVEKFIELLEEQDLTYL